MGAVARCDPEAELTLVEVDVAAVVDVCSRFVPGMVRRGRGAVLNVASVGAFGPLPGQASYGAAKAFVLSYTQSLGAELRGTGVSAATLCPGPVDTGFGDAAGFAKQDAEKMLPAVLWKSVGGGGQGRGGRTRRRQTVIVPGAFNRAAAVLYRLAPRRLLLPLLVRSHPGAKN